jgi:hypothetical protein
METRIMATATRTRRPAAKAPTPKAAANGTPAKVLIPTESVASEQYEQRVRDEMRTNAFQEMSPRMFRAIEELIHLNLTHALGVFNDFRMIKGNRLAEVEAALMEAAGLANALLAVGECAR